MAGCYVCEKGTLRREKVPYRLFGELIGNFDAEVCSTCAETFFDEETSRKITAITKAKGLFGLCARTKIGQAGSTLDIRLPKKLIRFLKLKKGTDISVYPESKNRLIIEI